MMLIALLLLCGKTLAVDLATRTVAGQPIAQFPRTHTTEIREGDPVDVLHINVCGHDAQISSDDWTGFYFDLGQGPRPGDMGWTDPVFRVNGVGVGSTVRAFDNRFGRGEYFPDEASGFIYRLPNDIAVVVGFTKPNGVYGKCRATTPEGARTCRVTSVRVVWGPYSK
jgi:hypothetical protein